MNVTSLSTLNRFRMGAGASGLFTGSISEFIVYMGDRSAYVADYQSHSFAIWGG